MVPEPLTFLNNREWAITFWLVVFAAWAATSSNVRASFITALSSLAEPKIIVPLVAMAGWVGGELWLGSRLGIWTVSLIKDAAIWFVTCGLVLFFNFEEASKNADFFRKKALAALLPVALLAAVLDIFVLPLILEILLQPLLAALVMMAAASKIGKRYRPLEKPASWILGLISLMLVARAVFTLITQWSDLDKTHLLFEAILPVWLSIGLLPFVYAVALYAAYELAFMRLNRGATGTRFVRMQRNSALLIGLHLNSHAVGSFAGTWPQRLAAASSFSEARAVVRDFRRTLRELPASQAQVTAQP